MKSIQATQQSIEIVFKNQFVIPDFQRPYSWDESKCAQLFSDIVSSFRDLSKEDKYFLGNIIYYTDKSGEKVWKIVDGQQRLTTLLMLMRALYAKTDSNPDSPLKELIYKIARHSTKTNENKEGDPRLESNVISAGSGYGANDLRNTLAIKQDVSSMHKKNPFRLNYECLEKNLDEWWSDGNSKNLEGFIDFLMDNVVLLPIKCEGPDDALSLFETINDRGMPLDDADVFKAKIYNAVDEKKRPEFIQIWSSLKNHVSLFHAYMYILKAKEVADNKTSIKRAELRKYIRTSCLENQNKPLNTGWKSIMKSLELCHVYKTNVGEWDSDKVFSAKEGIYWAILAEHPTKEYWKYPLFVFMHKHAVLGEDGLLVLSSDKKQEYLDLLENTVKFFFAMGVTKKNIDSVRNPSHKVCVQIEKGGDYLSIYEQEKKKVLEDLQEKLSDCDYKKYRTGLVFLRSFLNSNQQKGGAVVAYAKIIGGKKAHIEYILPQKWRIKYPYEGWDKESHEEYVNKIGNIMPLEQKTDIMPLDSFFRSKQSEYKSSKIEDARSLSDEKKHANWYPEDLEKRDKESVNLLMEFFRS